MTNGDHVLHALQNFPELTAGDLRVYAAILDNPEASRDELASAAGLHPSTVSAARRKLEMAARCGIHWPKMSPNRDIAMSPPHDHEHDMSEKIVNDDDDDDGNDFTEIHATLDFLSEPNRTRIAKLPQCTLNYAQDARTWFFAPGPKLTAKNEIVDSPAAYLVRIMKNGDPIPAIQSEWPGAACEVEEEVSSSPRLAHTDLRTAHHLIESQLWPSQAALKYLRENWSEDLENYATPEDVAEAVIDKFL